MAASFTVEDVPGADPGTYRFTSTTPTVNGFTPLLSWDFGDGTTSQGPTTVIHRFTTPGTKLVTLTAELGGATSRTTKPVDVPAPQLEVSIALVNAATAPTVEITPAGKDTPNRTVRFTVSASRGVGSIQTVTVTELGADPASALQVLTRPDPTPFSLVGGGSRSFDVPVAGRLSARVEMRVGVSGTGDDGVQQRATAATRFAVGDSGGLDSSLAITVEEPGSAGGRLRTGPSRSISADGTTGRPSRSGSVSTTRSATRAARR